MFRNLHARGFEGPDLVGSRACTTLDDRAGVSHTFAGRSGLTGDEGDNRLGHLGGNILRGFIFISSTDLPDQDYLFCLWIMFEHFENIDEVRAIDRVAADTHTSG